MRLSTKGQYALEAMLTMAIEGQAAMISIHAIGQKTGISDPYLEQIFSNLRRAGLIDSTRGTQGGYQLAREPEDITVGQVLRAGEGSLAPVRCSEQGVSFCEAFDTCMTSPLWKQMSEAISSVIDRITLADLVSRWHEEQETCCLDFTI